MTVKSLTTICAIVIGCAMAAGVSCDKPTEPTPEPTKILEILAPTGGETYTVGSTVEVRWKINDPTKISSVGLKISLNGGITYTMLYAIGSFPPETTTYSWTVEAGQVSSNCMVKVYEYQDESINDKSAVFTVQ